MVITSKSVYDYLAEVESKASVVSNYTDHMHADLMTKELVFSSWHRHVRAL